MTSIRLGATGVLVCALLAVVVTGGTARATPPPSIPADVGALFAGDAMRHAQAGAAEIDADFTGARIADIHEVFTFSRGFLAGASTPEAVTSTGRWMGAIERGVEVLGTVDVWKPDGGPAELSAYSSDAVLGSVLLQVSAAEILILDAPRSAFYALDGRTVRPLNRRARDTIAGPTGLSAVQQIVAAPRTAGRDHAGRDAGPSPAVPLGVVGLVLAGAGGLALLSRRRSADVRRPARGPARPRERPPGGRRA
ncbi:MAG: hypothetical protein ACXVX3_06105 [Blastococcus sp.]